jgi:uncharacterized protein YbaP (TraB family)
MKKQTIKYVMIFSLIAILPVTDLVQDSLSQSNKSFLWKVQSKTNTVYIFGSIHYLKKEMYPLEDKIEKAFKESDVLAVEADVTNVEKLDVQKLFGGAFYPENDTLEKHLSPRTYAILKKELNELGASLEAANKYKPWFLAISLVSLEISKLGFDPNYGIDRYFLSKASETKKILELESLEYQFHLSSSLSEKDQELFLVYTLKDIKVLEKELDRLVKAWRTGDERGVESIITKTVKEDKRLVPIFEKFIYERNRNMASKIEDYLKTKETYFVVVGAGHLVGRQGIIQILKSKGFTVEQL